MKLKVISALFALCFLVTGCGNGASSSVDMIPSVSDGEIELVEDTVYGSSSGDSQVENDGSLDANTGAYLASRVLGSDSGEYIGNNIPGHGSIAVDEVWSYGGFDDVHPIGVSDLLEFTNNQAMYDWIQYMSKWCYCYYGSEGEGYNKLSLYLESSEVEGLSELGDCQFRFVSRSLGANPKEWFIECRYEGDSWYVAFDLSTNEELLFKDEYGNTRVCYILGFEDDMKLALDSEDLDKPKLVILNGVSFE